MLYSKICLGSFHGIRMLGKETYGLTKSYLVTTSRLRKIWKQNTENAKHCFLTLKRTEHDPYKLFIHYSLPFYWYISKRVINYTLNLLMSVEWRTQIWLWIQHGLPSVCFSAHPHPQYHYSNCSISITEIGKFVEK